MKQKQVTISATVSSEYAQAFATCAKLTKRSKRQLAGLAIEEWVERNFARTELPKKSRK